MLILFFILALLLYSQIEQGTPEVLEVRIKGALVQSYRLPLVRTVEFEGALGITQVEMQGYKVRVLKDPGPLQLCVQNGWIERANQVLLCLPNQVALLLTGSQLSYDTRTY